MTISINHSVAIDLEVRDTRGPVHNFPADADTGHFVEVLISDDISVTVSTAADAQELEFRFAAARHYLIGEPVLAAIDLGDAGDDITDALVPDTAQPADIPHTECMASAPSTRLVCTLPPGHQGDHEAHGINCFAPPYETWPHTAGLPVPAEVAR